MRSFPSLEYVLQGSIQDEHVELLRARLQGLCDNITGAFDVLSWKKKFVCRISKNSGEVEQFDDHEIVYILRVPGASNVSLRVRYALDDLPNPIYHLRYIATAEPDKSQNVSVRQFHDCCVTKNIQSFLGELGFTFDYEFYAKGDIFRKGRMKIVVAKISIVKQKQKILSRFRRRKFWICVFLVNWTSSTGNECFTSASTIDEFVFRWIIADRIDSRRSISFKFVRNRNKSKFSFRTKLLTKWKALPNNWNRKVLKILFENNFSTDFRF